MLITEINLGGKQKDEKNDKDYFGVHAYFGYDDECYRMWSKE